MSSSAQSGPDAPTEKKKGLLSRMKTVLKKVDGSKRLSFSSKVPVAGSSTTKPALTPVIAPVEEKPAPVEAPKALPEGPQPKKVIRSDIDAERARKLGERFRVTIDPQQFSSKRIEKEVYRIEKPIRMRIHRQCHKCNTIFGGNKICASCDHVRCKNCPRSPAKKTDKKDKKVVAPVDVPGVLDLEADTYWGLQQETVLTRPNPKPGRQPLVRKKPMQRVRRTCCECSSLFLANAKTCTGCSHSRCVDCPRDPAKKKQYPDGYPGDAPSKDTSIPVKYCCHKCNKVYAPVPHPASGEEVKQDCVRCGHERCPTCPIAPRLKVEPEPDPEIVKKVEAKLAALTVSPTPA
ncbi:hypothetical protein GLAREA_10637 [Glarea lozoyensis ATCC 20868]|uniref:Uncharacterized protein n=1 Tax=Glarea lozoyensis (strain ATCC 20868 / MF5171) TaxID=1116229 RepID=S3D900_GLAL2|nr:uncharacterized protein GLAREA_10637 [Glarea lozoyensis ATCC 20868]EPE34942.1 hypothetical protein GLAREA_10637 [Glarea lozoyensis ATCC 20868]